MVATLVATCVYYGRTRPPTILVAAEAYMPLPDRRSNKVSSAATLILEMQIYPIIRNTIHRKAKPVRSLLCFFRYQLKINRFHHAFRYTAHSFKWAIRLQAKFRKPPNEERITLSIVLQSPSVLPCFFCLFSITLLTKGKFCSIIIVMPTGVGIIVKHIRGRRIAHNYWTWNEL